jgi:DNA-binding response OmpR family regulator
VKLSNGKSVLQQSVITVIFVLTIQLPELDGLTVMRRLRADTDVSAIPVIAVTALAMPGDRERGLAAGATRYLAKPVSGRTLIATIAEILAAQRGVASLPCYDALPLVPKDEGTRSSSRTVVALCSPERSCTAQRCCGRPRRRQRSEECLAPDRLG